MTYSNLTAAQHEAEVIGDTVRGMTAERFASHMNAHWGLWDEPQRTCIRAAHRFANVTNQDELEVAREMWESTSARILDGDDALPELTLELHGLAEAAYEVALCDNALV